MRERRIERAGRAAAQRQPKRAGAVARHSVLLLLNLLPILLLAKPLAKLIDHGIDAGMRSFQNVCQPFAW